MDSIIKKKNEKGVVILIPIAFVNYLFHFHVDRDYFECHEVLEEYWKKETIQEKNSIWVGFILLAVANYHHRRNNFSGAIKTLEKAISIFINKNDDVEKLGFNANCLFEVLKMHLEKLSKNEAYCSYNLPISDKILLNYCFTFNDEAKQNWGNKSDLSDNNIIHRHKLRDRSEIIADRKKAKLQRIEKDSE